MQLKIIFYTFLLYASTTIPLSSFLGIVGPIRFPNMTAIKHLGNRSTPTIPQIAFISPFRNHSTSTIPLLTSAGIVYIGNFVKILNFLHIKWISLSHLCYFLRFFTFSPNISNLKSIESTWQITFFERGCYQSNINSNFHPWKL